MTLCRKIGVDIELDLDEATEPDAVWSIGCAATWSSHCRAERSVAERTIDARARRLIRLEDLVGQRVPTADGQVVGRIEKVRETAAERRSRGHGFHL
jgi:hypothetical protein